MNHRRQDRRRSTVASAKTAASNASLSDAGVAAAGSPTSPKRPSMDRRGAVTSAREALAVPRSSQQGRHRRRSRSNSGQDAPGSTIVSLDPPGVSVVSAVSLDSPRRTSSTQRRRRRRSTQERRNSQQQQQHRDLRVADDDDDIDVALASMVARAPNIEMERRESGELLGDLDSVLVQRRGQTRPCGNSSDEGSGVAPRDHRIRRSSASSGGRSSNGQRIRRSSLSSGGSRHSQRAPIPRVRITRDNDSSATLLLAKQQSQQFASAAGAAPAMPPPRARSTSKPRLPAMEVDASFDSHPDNGERRGTVSLVRQGRQRQEQRHVTPAMTSPRTPNGLLARPRSSSQLRRSDSERDPNSREGAQFRADLRRKIIELDESVNRLRHRERKILKEGVDVDPTLLRGAMMGVEGACVAMSLIFVPAAPLLVSATVALEMMQRHLPARRVVKGKQFDKCLEGLRKSIEALEQMIQHLDAVLGGELAAIGKMDRRDSADDLLASDATVMATGLSSDA